MNFSDVLKALNQASAFELYRMRAATFTFLDELAANNNGHETAPAKVGHQQ
jgi:hypothetical protein